MAIAHRKDICLVCSATRQRFPFDVQHRLIIGYTTGSPSDFQALRGKIIDRIKAIAKSRSNRAVVTEIVRQESPGEELTEFEIACLGTLAGNVVLESHTMGIYSLRREMVSIGYTELATNAALRKLQKRGFGGFISFTEDRDEGSGEYYDAVQMTAEGWQWVEDNLSKYNLKKQPPSEIPF